MPGGYYVDNAMNRRLGRVGKPIGSVPQHNGNRGGSSARQASPNTHDLNGSGNRYDSRIGRNPVQSNTYVDNAENRRLGRVGLPKGSAVVSKKRDNVSNGANGNDNRCDSRIGRHPVQRDTYVDNAENRRLGRVGLPKGSAVVSKNNDHVSNSAKGNDNSYDSRIGRNPVQRDTYVDNAENRRLGRVGLPKGSAVVSKNNDHVSNSAKGNDNSYDSRIGRNPVQRDTYVDNAENRRLGRVGLPKGSAVVSKNNDHVSNGAKGNDNRYDSERFKTYDYENSCTNGNGNRCYSGFLDHERETVESESSVPRRVYVDNPQNRKLGRVGMPHGEAVIYKGSDTSFVLATKQKVYVDNPTNRRLGRVGLPLGTAVFSAKNKCIMRKTYDDTPMNRKLDRVGKPLGSLPLKKSKTTDKIPKFMEMIENGDDFSDYFREERGDISCDLGFALIDSQGDRVDAFDEAMYRHNRNQEEISWGRSEPTKGPPKTQFDVLADYKGKKIPFEELKLRKVIGRGGFGKVHFAKWKETVVAVKKLISEKISDARIRDFAVEVMKFCTLEHPNIVTFLGACVEKPDLCIVMEYMQMTLFDALYIEKDTEFSEDEKLDVINQITEGMDYLHSHRIVHCDLKPPNILMDYVKDESCEVKITDFGLSMIIHDTSVSSEELVRNIGTPQYSPPEMLRGEILSAKDMMKADVYSLALVFVEVIFKSEPFPNYSLQQLKTEVGFGGKTPEIPTDSIIDQSIEEIMDKALSFNPLERPSMTEIRNVVRDCQTIYNTN